MGLFINHQMDNLLLQNSCNSFLVCNDVYKNTCHVVLITFLFGCYVILVVLTLAGLFSKINYVVFTKTSLRWTRILFNCSWLPRNIKIIPGKIDTLFFGLPINWPATLVAKSNASPLFEKSKKVSCWLLKISILSEVLCT